MAELIHRRQGGAHAARLLMWILVATIAVNALCFAAAIANPLLFSDNWTFVDTFLRVAIEDGAGFGDFLVKRAGLDHAQPLNKLLMLLNFRWFGLDFAIESRVAMAFAVAGWGVLWAVVVRDHAQAGRDERDAPTVALLLAALAAVHLSLNSVDLYVYPMVTMAHAFYLLAFLTMYAAWCALAGRRWWPLPPAALACGVIGDDSAILLGLAIALAVLLYAARSGRWAQALRVLLVLALVLAACRGLYAAFGEIRGATQAVFNVPFGERVAGLAAQWRDAWQWLAVPLSAGIASADPLRALFGGQWLAARLGLAAIVLCAHVWFWRQALRARPGAAWFMAVSVMLMFYANAAGILLGRVFVRGPEFLDQMRYVVFYQTGVVALLLMALAPRAADQVHRKRAWTAAAAIALLALQVPLSWLAWKQVAKYDAYYARMAGEMAAMARDPRNPPPGCGVGIDICVRPEATRVAVMALLVEHRINLFSPRFQQRHPALAEAADLTPSPQDPAR